MFDAYFMEIGIRVSISGITIVLSTDDYMFIFVSDLFS